MRVTLELNSASPVETICVADGGQTVTLMYSHTYTDTHCTSAMGQTDIRFQQSKVLTIMFCTQAGCSLSLHGTLPSCNL